MTKQKRHHGDLYEALIVAGIELMEAGGPEALSLRKCAARAGVSHAAPAHHFNGVVSLKAAIVARSYGIFTKTMQAHREGISEPRARLIAICEGYLAFSREHNALFRFMFQPFADEAAQINPPILQELEARSAAAYDELAQACAAFAPVGGQARGTETLVWSLVHGYAMLFASREGSETPHGRPPDFAQILPEFQRL